MLFAGCTKQPTHKQHYKTLSTITLPAIFGGDTYEEVCIGDTLMEIVHDHERHTTETRKIYKSYRCK